MSHKIKLYKVGGCVRDEILGIKSNDIDYVVVIEPDHYMCIEDGFGIMKQYLESNGFKIFLSIPHMFTIRAKDLSGGLAADFILAKKETYELGSLYDDLIRRDFTINTMVKSEDGVLIDLFGGENDLKNRILRTPGSDPLKTMMDDPLRMLRGLRFSQKYNLKIDDDLIIAMMDVKVIDKLFRDVSCEASRERIREELTKMFKYSTKETLRTLFWFEGMASIDKDKSFFDRLFCEGGVDVLWLKPTNEKIK